MIDDKMREAVDEQLPRDRFGDDPREYFCMGYEAACASNAAEIAEANLRFDKVSIIAMEAAKQLDKYGQQLAAANEKIKFALEALKHYTDVVVSINDPNDFTPKVSDAGNFAKEAITLLERRDEE